MLLYHISDWNNTDPKCIFLTKLRTIPSIRPPLSHHLNLLMVQTHSQPRRDILCITNKKDFLNEILSIETVICSVKETRTKPLSKRDTKYPAYNIYYDTILNCTSGWMRVILFSLMGLFTL